MSARLSFCLKAATTLQPLDLEQITASIEAYAKAGMAMRDAEMAAVNDLLAEVENERTEMVGLLREQHAGVFEAPAPTPESTQKETAPAVAELATLGSETDKQPAAPPAGVEALTPDDAGQKWTRMTQAERSALAGRAGWNPNTPMTKAAWADINSDRQKKLRAAMDQQFEAPLSDQRQAAAPAEDLDAMFAELLAEELSGSQTTAPPAAPAPKTWPGKAWDAASVNKRIGMLQAIGKGDIAGHFTRLGWMELSDNMRASLLAKQGLPPERAPRKPVTPQVPRAQPPTRTATQDAASAAVNSAKAVSNAIDGLGKLFGGGGKLGSGLSFDEESYAKAKPLFLAALGDAKAAAADLREAMRKVLRMVLERFGVDTAKAMQPYVVRFITDVREGRIALSDTANQEAADGPDDAGADGAQTLGAVAAPEGGGAEGRGDAERGDPGSGVSGPAGDRGADEPGVSGTRSGGSGSTSVRAPEAGTGRGGRSRGKGRAGEDGSAVPADDEAVHGPGPAGLEPGLSDTPATEPVSVPNLPAVNFRITPDLRLGKGGEVEKFNDNIAAITALKAIETEGRHATPAEQRLLARYVGWGGLANAFPNPESKQFKPEWTVRGTALAELLTGKEYQLARRSTLDSHFTSQDVVAAMWVAARRLGFKGGIALETSMGSGNFLGLMPDALVGNTRFVGVEYDSLTARIAALLYPQETVLNAGFQEVPLSDGSFDLNIGNPPFGDQSLRFQFKPGLNGVSIHNQFIRAALDALKPGGLQIQVVSRYLMDKQDKSDRIALAKKARLVGAIRLPDTAFKENARTEVVTDILFLQRLTPAEEAHMDEVFAAAARKPEKDRTRERDRWLLADQVPDWVNVARVRDPLGGEAMVVGNYFANNPQMVLGTLERSGSMQFGGDITVRFDKGASLPDALAGAIARLPQDVMQQDPNAIVRSLERFKGMSDALRIALAGHEAGAIAIDKDGKLHQVVERMNPQGDFELAQRELTPESPWSATLLQTSEGGWYTLEVQLDAEGKPAKVMKGDTPTKRNRVVRRDFASDADISAGLRLGPARFERLKKLVALRDLFVKQINLETEDAHTAEMEGNRRQLAAAYNSFTHAHGWISDPANSALVGDMPDGALVQALETDYAPAITALRAKTLGEPARAATAKPSPILTQRVIPKYEPPGMADSPADALQIALSEFGRVNLERMAALLGKTEQEVIAALHDDMAKPLIFKDPETGTWQTRNDYLSGQVRRKLIAARAQGLPKNVEALEAVQPALWGAENVTALVGSTWVPPAIYADFYKHMTGQTPHISFGELTNTFAVRMPAPSSKNHNDEWGSDGMRVETIIERMLNTAPVRVYDQTSDGPQVNHELTKLAQLRATQIATEWDNWVFGDGTRRDALVAIFNEKFNTRVQRQHDGSHLVLPGKVPDAILKMRRHQKNAIWRGISERFTLYDHVVGSGKTFTAIARVMERRRMGLSKKAMIVVPNHMVAEWTNSVYRLYPGAKVLALGKSDLNSKRRRKVFAKIAAGDQDIVIVPHSSFGFIGIAKETEQRYLEIELLAAEQAIRDAWEASEESPGAFRKPHTVKQAERLRDKMQARMDRIKGRDKADRLLTFEQLGVDDLTVDEAHEFKNLFYSSRLTDVRGMGNAAGSQKAFDLYNKVRTLRESPTGSVTFMTGTPISNSAVEMYNMMRYLAADELKGLGLEHFDAFRAQFVSTNPGWEPDPTGRLKEVNRLGRTWSNMRSLMDLYYSFTDSVGNDDIKSAYKEDNAGAEFPIPKVKGGDRHEVVVQPTAAQSTELSDVMAGFDALPGIQDPYDRNIARLRLWDRARKVSLDVRAASPGNKSDEKGGKLDVLARQVARIHKAWTSDLGTQLVFLDRSVPKAKGDDKIIKDYDAKVATRDAALAAGEEEAYREALDALSTIDPNEIEALRAAQAGGWNAYQQIKDNLIALGIPASEVRFIQEANNDAQKQALFDAVNAGQVRVLIGSTQRMGAGTNVQQRLVGLHHADVTWKPSDIEQREGRIIRQGNKLLAKYGIDKFEVEILAYATERTIDATMWALNSSKLRTINGIRKYDGAFTMEFDDEESVSMAHLAALASGDPKLMERVKLGSQIDKLELLERANRRKNFGIESSIDQAERNIKHLPGDITKYEQREKVLSAAVSALRERVAKRRVTVEGEEFSSQFLAARAAQESAKAQVGEPSLDQRQPVVEGQPPKEAKGFSLTIDGKKYRGLNGAQEAIQDALGDDSPFEMVIGAKTYIRRVDAQREIARLAHEAAKKIGDTGSESLDLGTFAGLKLEGDVIRTAGSGNVYSVELTVVAPDGKTLASSRTERREDTDFSTAGLATAVRALDLDPSDTARQAALSRAYLESAHADLPDLLKRRNQAFPQQGELDAKRARLEAVTRELAGTAPVPDVSTNLAQTGAPEANETDVVFADIGRGKPREQTPGFMHWFKGSKVVDADGKPLVVYHGTGSPDIATFDAGKTSDLGFHFGDVEAASYVMDRERMQTPGAQLNALPIYLSIRNPLRLGDTNFSPFQFPRALADQLERGIATGIDPRELRELADSFDSLRGRPGAMQKAAQQTIEFLEGKGFDGLVYRNKKEGRGESWVAFKPAQIKSAIGNSGAFDPANPSIVQNIGRGKEAPTYPMAGAEVDGLVVRDRVPNTSSIAASLGSNYTVLPGIREVPFSLFNGAGTKTTWVERLMAEIKESGEINPLIVAVDAEGPYILEGGHRYDALQHLGHTSFPAMVVLDDDAIVEDRGRGKLERLGTQIARQGYERATVPRVQAANEFQKLIAEHAAGRVTDGQFVMRSKVLADRMSQVADTKAANRLLGERVRDVDHVRTQLLTARRKGELDHQTVEFALWALDKNPALAANLGVSIRAAKDDSPAADYNPAAEIMRLFKGGGGSTDTIVHEILHHAERMMPEDMQAAIRKEWARALATAIRKGTPEQVEALKLVPLAVTGDKAAYSALVKAIHEGPLNYDKHYALVNPSEFWAVNGARLLGEHHAAKDSIWQRIRVWLRELVQKVRALVGLPSTAPIIRALHYVTDASHFGLERGGRFESARMLSDPGAIKAMGGVLRSAKVEKIVGALPEGNQYVVVHQGAAGEERSYHRTEAEASAAAAKLGTTPSRSADAPPQGLQPVQPEGGPERGLDVRVRAVIERRASDSVRSVQDALQRMAAGTLKQKANRVGRCFPLAAEASMAGLGDMVIGLDTDSLGNQVWHAVVQRGEAIYDPTYGQWFEPGVYEAMNFAPKLTLTPSQVREYVQSHDGIAPDALNQGLTDGTFQDIRRFDPARRQVLMGAAAALASAQVSGAPTLGRARPIDAAIMARTVEPAVAKILRGNGATNLDGAKALKQALGLIAASGPLEVRALAAEIAALLPERNLMLTVDDKRLVNAHGVVELAPWPHLTLFTAEGRSGLTYGTLLHEALHAAVAARYRSLSTAGVRSNDVAIKMAAPAASAELAQFVAVWHEFRNVVKADLAAGIGDADLKQSLEQAGSPDEFFVRALTDATLQAYLASKPYEGSTLLERFRDWIKSTLLGFKKTGTTPSWLDAALAATNDLKTAMVKDAADFKRLGAMNSLARQGNLRSAMFSVALSGSETAPARSPWLDATNRAQFAPGQWIYSALGSAFEPLWRRIGFKAMSTELKHQMRAMNLEVQRAQELSVAVSQQMQTFSAEDRDMVSDIVEQELAAGVTPPAHAIRVAALMSQTMTAQSARLVELGMLSEAAAQRWDGKYLPRFYRSKLRKQLGDAWADAVRRLTRRQTSVMKGIRGNHLKMRGLLKTIPVAELPDFLALGWEVRDAGYEAFSDQRHRALEAQPDEVQVWRDWTREERDARGEIRDANFRFVMGYMQTQRDIALGTMFAGMAADPAQSSRLPPEGLDWVAVPRAIVEGTGVNRYGKLAGRYVPRETMSHLSQIEEASSAFFQTYRKGMGVWKEGKTALNPGSHVNNTVGNTIMAHLAGVGFHRADKYVGALKDFIWKAPMVTEAKDAGLFLGSMSSTELLDSLPKELRDLVAKSDSRTVQGAKIAYDALTLGLRRPLGALYGAEDTFFRYLLYKDARSRGVAPNDAVDHAQRFIFTYDDLPKGARRVRDFGIPFFGYTYKAAPALLHTFLTHPVRFGTAAALIWAANAAAYAIAAGDDDDDWDERLRRYAMDSEYRKKVLEMEAEEYAHLPPWQRGLTAMFTRKVIRLGTDALTRLPLFIDVSRMIPGNDLAEVAPHVPGAGWLPQPLTPSHPAITFVAGWMANTDLWTGKVLVDANDETGEAAAKRAEWIWKLASPAIAPGNAHWERAMNALAQANGGEVPWVPEFIGEDYTGIGKDGLAVQPGYAALQTFGIKVRPQDLDTSERIDEAKKGQMIRGIVAELYKLKRQNNLGAVNDKQFERERVKAVEKIGRVREGLTVDGAER